MTRRSIPVAGPDLADNEEKYVAEAIRTSWITSTGLLPPQGEVILVFNFLAANHDDQQAT